MSKTTNRYDESFTIPADATAADLEMLFMVTIRAIADSKADIDWANLEISSERNLHHEIYTLTRETSYLAEWTTVTLTARGRK